MPRQGRQRCLQNFHPSSTVKDEQRLVTTRTIASLVAVSTRTVQNWVQRGVISYYKIGKSIRFCPVEVFADLEKFRSEAGE